MCHKVDTLGGKQDLTVINESGLYSLLFYMQPQKAKGVSQNDNAINERVEKLKKFKRWVTSEVLHSIRKHGMYATDELLNNPDLLISVATALKAEREKNIQLTTTIAVNNQIISELKPKADYMDDILNNKGLVTITQIAKDYGMTGGEMNALLHDKGVQYKQSGQWLLYNKHAKQGYTHSETVPITHSDGRPDIKMNTKWTQKGRLFLYNLLKSDGIFPVIELDEKSA